MENGNSVYDYASPVHRVLLEPNVMFGIGVGPAVAIAILTVVLIGMVHPFTGLFGIVLYLLAKRLCRKDPHALEILFSRIAVPDIWEAS